ncbi:hypothetical protein [Pyrococcus yayanosii]|uniref:Uncharacterized protein n=1 Tax=Pyrococcus yayanosii (strain CH1 / JCM 16557) TaxID=529709 RepID=F8AJ88_PYRYC|nr:hypothetical protein [Pyrococcus yayanosii]AEH24529.1 hypothetical protein PYCH_08440 [Pyrococcus yayanosii CH1]
MIERIRLREELDEEAYERVLKTLEMLKERFPNVLVRKTKTGEKVSFIDIDVCGGINFDIIVGVRERPFVAVEMEGKKAVYAFGIMRFLLEEACVEFKQECDGSDAYLGLKRKLRAKNLLDFLLASKR